jgi:hypothetical protein
MDKPEYCKCGKAYLRTDWGEPRDAAILCGELHTPNGCNPRCECACGCGAPLSSGEVDYYRDHLRETKRCGKCFQEMR